MAITTAYRYLSELKMKVGRRCICGVVWIQLFVHKSAEFKVLTCAASQGLLMLPRNPHTLDEVLPALTFGELHLCRKRL